MRIIDVAKTSYSPRLRIINLVDILIILLLFFVATTTFRQEAPMAVKVNLPEAKTAAAVGREAVGRLVITVAKDDQILVDGRPTSLLGLEKALRDAKAKDPAVQIQFSADRTVSYGTVVSIVDAARAAGVTDITAFTRKSVQ